MTLIEQIHGRYVHGRRVRVLAGKLSALIPDKSTVLDVGCGDGRLAQLLLKDRPSLSLIGVDVLVRPDACIPVAWFDGKTLPQADHSVDVVMLVDVLHHTEDPNILLREAVRVARQALIVKDHLREGLFAGSILRFMDEIGNRRHGVALPHNYWTRAQWRKASGELKVTTKNWDESLHLYPFAADWLFGGSLHFIARWDV